MTLLKQPDDFEDELLGEVITESDLVAADDYVRVVASRLGVLFSQIPTDPVPLIVKDLALAVAYERRARLKSGIQPAAYRGGDQEDAYEAKRKIYAKERDRLVAEIGVSDFLGQDPGQDPPQTSWCVPMVRG